MVSRTETTGIDDDITRSIALFARATHAQRLTPERRDALVARIMDALGCAVASVREPEVARIATALGIPDARGNCTALLTGRASVADAAFLNGVMIRYYDWNDTYVGRNGGHPSDLIPLALAAGEHGGKSGDQVLRALNAGHHLMLDMCDGSNALARGWDHATYVGIAATVVAGLLGDLDARQLAQAISMTAAAGNMLLARSTKVSTWRSLASPYALRTALFVTDLAKAGISGPDPVFTGHLGFLEVVSGDMTLELDVSRNRAGDSHLKRYPAVFHAQAPVELALALRADIVTRLGVSDIARKITSVEVSTHAFGIKWAASKPLLWEPENRETADHSIPFMVALALLRGEIDHHDLEAAIGDPAIRALTRIVRVNEDPAFSARWPREAPARITVVAAGENFSRQIGAGSGHASNPLSFAARADKLLANATPVVGAARAEAFAATLAHFADLKDISAALIL